MIPSISVEDLKMRMDANADFFLLDVRQPEEHEAYRIREGLLIPVGELMDRKYELEMYRDKEIVVYCRSGARSAQAVGYLNHIGFNCKNMNGGILAWQSMLEGKA